MADETHLFGEPLDDATGMDDADVPAPVDRSREAALVAAGLSVLAGVLCIVAPFRAVYTLRTQGISASFDGWGRYDLATGSQHGPRYGVALTVAALVLVIAAATRLRDLRPLAQPQPDLDAAYDTEQGPDIKHGQAASGGDDRLAAAVGIAGSGVLLGVLASVALNVESTVSNASAIASTSGGADTTVDIGGMLWFLLGGWIVSVVALYLPWLEARRRG